MCSFSKEIGSINFDYKARQLNFLLYEQSGELFQMGQSAK